MASYIDFAERVLGRDLKPSNSEWVLRATPAEWRRACESYRAAFNCTLPPGRGFLWGAEIEAIVSREHVYPVSEALPGEYRPLLFPDVHPAAGMLTTVHDWSPGRVAQALGTLKKYLLYAHRVILPDPLFSRLLALEHADDETLRSTWRLPVLENIAGFLDFLHQVRPLCEAGVVEFFPAEETIAGHLPHDSQLKDQDFAAWLDSWSAGGIERMFYEGGQVHLATIMLFCVRYDATLSFEELERRGPSPSQVLEAYLKHGSLSAVAPQGRLPRTESAGDRRVLSRLHELSLPGVEALPIPEVVAVRRNSDAFQVWREALADGIQQIEALNPLADERVLRRAVSDKLAPAEQKVREEMRQGSLGTVVRDQAVAFTLGAAAAAVTGDPLVGGIGAAGSSAASILTWWYSGRAERRSRKALSRHFAVWHPSP